MEVSKIKTGDARVQIAQINAAKDEVKEAFDRADLIAMVEELENEVESDTGIQPDTRDAEWHERSSDDGSG